MPLRIAVIGVGHWHALKDAAYLSHLPALPDIALAALHDSETGRAAQVAAALDPALGSPRLFTDYRAMLAATKPDFVLTLGRHDTMAEIAHCLLDENYPFLMEKPMGVTAAETRGIAEKADATGGFAAVPLFQRYQPFVTTARAMIAAGRFGPLSHMSLRNIRPTSDRYVQWGAPWMLDPAAAGGGCLRNVGLHGFDMFCHILDEHAEVIGAQTSRRALGQPVEDYAIVQLRSAGGVLGTVEVGNTFPYGGPPKPEAGYRRADGEFRLSGRDALLTAKEGNLHTVTADAQETISASPTEPPALAMLRDTLDCWRRGEKPVTDAWDCWRAMMLADRAYEMAGKSE